MIRNATTTALCTTLAVTLLFGLQSAASQSLTPNEELGKLIFFDETLSINGNQSCAACHGPDVGWTGPDPDINAGGSVYEGSIPDSFGARKPPSSAYATLSPIFHFSEKAEHFVGGNFWDGRATGEKLGNPAADQAQGPFLNPLEQALASSADVVERICSGSYGDLFRAVWSLAACDPGNVEMAYDNVALSIAAYEASPEVNAFSSKFDASKKGGAKLTKLERKGRALFKGKAKCSRCHPVSGKRPLFTDFTFDNLGIPRNPANPVYDTLGADWVDMGLGGFLESRPEYADEAEENNGKHKVPTLRNVAKAPDESFVKAFGHNGYFKSLKQIVHFYNTRDVKPVCGNPFTLVEDAMDLGCWPEPEVAENVNTDELGDLGLRPEDEDAIVAFMETLSDGYVPPTE